jgi:hypothetical protein
VAAGDDTLLRRTADAFLHAQTNPEAAMSTILALSRK